MAITLNDFDQQVALISGGAMGIGRATAQLFAKRGARIAFFDIREAEGRQFVEALQRDGTQASFYPCNVTRGTDIKQGVEKVLHDFGQIDVLVNVAGGSQLKPIWELTEEDWDAQINLNLKAAFLCSRAVIPKMMERRRGCIISLASGQGASPAPGRAPYSAAKAGIIGFTRTAAAELGPHGIRVNAVAPGATRTERTLAQNVETGELDNRAATIPLGHIAEPEDIGNAVVFLASEMGRHMTGQVLFVNGGNLMP
ncbi:MAG: SDR family oxidoreductase [Deltaproteobacteria bacterium]|nr:SDR family oxidoreductase [Deltaproteobacteria bacterium]